MNVTFTPAVRQNNNNIQFRGAIGDKIVKEIVSGAEVKPDNVIKEIKGTFGIKTEKAADVLESFIEKIQELGEQVNTYAKQLYEANQKIHDFPQEKRQAVFDAEAKLNKSFADVIKAKDKELASKDAQLKEAREYAAKYEPMAKVKSVENNGIIMPKQVIKILDEIVANTIPARKSMEEFLFTGKGQQEALKQIERHSLIYKAYNDGMFMIPEVQNYFSKLKKTNSININTEQPVIQNLIFESLKSSPRGEYIMSGAIHRQVKSNAMALLTPYADNNYSNTSLEAINKNVEKTLQDVIEYYQNFTRGIQKYQRNYPNSKITYNRVDFDTKNSKVIIDYPKSQKPIEVSYDDVSNYGS